ncbi:MAG TPA: hypothetical protein VF282_02180, partial [Bacillota bacterium]
MLPGHLAPLLEEIPVEFDRGLFAAVYAEAAEVVASGRTPGREPAYRLLHGHRVARLGMELLAQPDVRAAGPGPQAALVVWLGGVAHDLFKDSLGADPPGSDHAALARDWAAERLPTLFGDGIARRVAEACHLHNKRHLAAPV